MSVVEELQEFCENHYNEHQQRLLVTKVGQFCEICYPPPPETKLTEQFNNFWYWFNTYCFALNFTSYTTSLFRIFINIFKDEPVSDQLVSNRITDIAYRIVGSIKYHTLLPIKLLVYYLINLTARTNYF